MIGPPHQWDCSSSSRSPRFERRHPNSGQPRVHLINPSDVSFGVAVITPRWLYVLAAATGVRWGDPHVIDETLDPIDPIDVSLGDVVGIGIHTGNALRGYSIGQMARARGAWVVFGGIHATLFPDEAHEHGGAHAVVRGDGDAIWPHVVEDCLSGRPLAVYEGGRIEADRFASARWDLLPEGRYMWGSVQTVRGCPKHCRSVRSGAPTARNPGSVAWTRSCAKSSSSALREDVCQESRLQAGEIDERSATWQAKSVAHDRTAGRRIAAPPIIAVAAVLLGR